MNGVVNIEDLRKLAKKRLPKIAYDFIEGGTDDEVGLVTPNVPELEALTGLSVTGEASMIAAARALAERFGCPVLAKGGHLPGDTLTDAYFAINPVRETPVL